VAEPTSAGHSATAPATATTAPGADLSPPPIVEFIDVEKTFGAGTRKAFTAIRDVTFVIEDHPGRGEFVALVGPSGCGKSTVLNLIQGFSDVYPPTRGEVRVRGSLVTGPGRDRGMIFQRYSSFPHLTVLDNVAFGLELDPDRRLPRREREDIARVWIERVGLGGHERKYPHQLSGGMQQRVALARSLVVKPRIILMDEPFSALDEPTRIEMQRLTTELWHELEATVLLITHSLTEAVYLGDRVWIMSKNPGRIARRFENIIPPTHDVDPLDVLASPEFEQAVREVSQAFREIESG
jgi:NitT/TauT family transport system ATP-binding protein